jgi:hypothetical protein
MAATRPKKKLPMGVILKGNLIRLGHVAVTVPATDIANAISKLTGKSVSRQRISAMLSAPNIEHETLEQLAKAIGVKADELTRDVELQDMLSGVQKAIESDRSLP